MEFVECIHIYSFTVLYAYIYLSEDYVASVSQIKGDFALLVYDCILCNSVFPKNSQVTNSKFSKTNGMVITGRMGDRPVFTMVWRGTVLHEESPDFFLTQ